MQHMDPEGRAAAVKFLKNMHKETLIIIEHGLAEAASSTLGFPPGLVRRYLMGEAGLPKREARTRR